MKKLILLLLVITTYSCLKAQNDKNLDKNQDSTTYYFVRHAEKDLSDSTNPELTATGLERAEKLANYFKTKTIDAVYSTNFNRTMSTAKPTAYSKGLETIVYDPTGVNYAAFLKETKGKSVLVVGHSNTIPGFVNSIIGENKYEEIDESIYSNLYIVTIENGEINSKLISQD